MQARVKKKMITAWRKHSHSQLRVMFMACAHSHNGRSKYGFFGISFSFSFTRIWDGDDLVAMRHANKCHKKIYEYYLHIWLWCDFSFTFLDCFTVIMPKQIFKTKYISEIMDLVFAMWNLRRYPRKKKNDDSTFLNTTT